MSEPDETHVNADASHPLRRRFGLGTVLLAILVGAGGGVGTVALMNRHPGHDHAHEDDGPQGHDDKKTRYTCPMHPTIVQDHPGDCPICGMKLVPLQATADPGAEEARKASAGAAPVEGLATVNIDPMRQQLIGLQSVEVKRGPVDATWRTVGRVQVDPTSVRKFNVKVDGFVERILVDFVGQPVRRGQPLLSVYSPELVSAQSEYLLARRTQQRLAASGSGASAEDGEALVSAARQKLRLWDVPQAEIERLERTGEASRTVTFVSPISGVVTAKNVVEGARIGPSETPYEITDLSHVWVMADAYESDLGQVHVGMPASLSMAAYPGQGFSGRVDFIDPVLDPKTRTVKVHLHFPNPGGKLKPEMFGEVTLHGQPQQGLTIPADAVIQTGTRQVVFIDLGEGKFQPREVQLGPRSGDTAEVRSGLSEGQKVVTRANFLIDSESRLRASLAAMGGK